VVYVCYRRESAWGGGNLLIIEAVDGSQSTSWAPLTRLIGRQSDARFWRPRNDSRQCRSLTIMTTDLQTSSGYPALLKEIKERVRTAQVRASLAVSRELILLYWSIGRDILVRQNAEGWGTKIIDRLAKDLDAEFPGVEGFSPRNLKYMRSLAEAWPDSEKSATACGTFAVGPSPGPAGQAQRSEDSRVVSARCRRVRLEPEHPRASDHQPVA